MGERQIVSGLRKHESCERGGLTRTLPRERHQRLPAARLEQFKEGLL